WSYKDHGKSLDKACIRESAVSFRWLHESFGSNFRMTEIQAAIGRAQLKKIPEWLVKRRQNADIFTEFFQAIPAVRTTIPPQGVDHAYYKYYVFVDTAKLKPDWNRDRLLQEISAQGVPCGSGSCGEIYLETAFAKAGLRPAIRFPVAQQLSATSLMFVIHPTLNTEDVKYMCQAIKSVFAQAM
ncbi:MAG: DegT/DnrJ/EryC1/StrS family aminotransferase, partial [Gammaproteobacteria bacterium]|nr:DegT/DnrJ/EryC1/StrS family aminotransferase [Gammaproteobacteria bacterium]